MSFGWDWNPKKPTTQKYPQFAHALDDLARPGNRMLLFSSASNGGANLRRTYPAAHQCVFAIHSSDYNGDSPGYNPSAEAGKNYITIGHEVPGYNVNTRESGTSLATPVAAALAAAIVRMIRSYTALHTRKAWAGNYIQEYDGMRKVFDNMSKKRGDYDYLDWANLFSESKDIEEICVEVIEWLSR